MGSNGPDALELYCHEVTVRFLDKAVVPPCEGSMIRGAFGRAFKEGCCPFPHENGAGCPLGDKCPYGYVFETSPPEDAREFAKNREVPRPYVFEPPEGTKMEYAPGEKMRFGFTVVGRAAEYIPYFIYAFSKMGEEGIGRLRARYALERMIVENPFSGTREEIFDGEMVKNRRMPTSWNDAASAAPEDGWDPGAPGVRDPDFHQVQRRGLSRSSLFRGGGPEPPDPHPDALSRPLR